ncbi:hypothetical protein [Marinomonas balearica]|uniref:Uncharacterized protein n=1 Tax=Marinomonas balearica TaxID=491947 RepID=A0A4R6M7M7_9GAMM|nr:hypothetical protein [Marinomonas balearica]TDO97383.1 hypothetical protein DFP79_2201 [Marinomonas balearica]
MKRPIYEVISGVGCALLSSLSFANSTLDDFRMHAPADTPLYFEGNLTENTASFSSMNSSDDDIKQAFHTFFSDPSASDFIGMLLSDMTQFSQGNATLLHEYGFTLNDTSAFYFEGGLPVFQATSAQPQTFVNKVISVAESQLFDAKRESWKGQEVFTWPLTIEEFKGESPQLAVAQNGNLISLGLFFKSDSLETKLSRLGFIPETLSLKETGKLNTLVSKFDLSDEGKGFIDLEQLALMVTASKNHSGSKDLQKLGLKPTPDACNADIQMFAQSAPLIVSSFNSETFANDTYNVHYKTIWEIKNDEVRSGLQRLNGHLSATTLNNSGALASVGLGVDVNTLIPVLTNFWMQFQSLELTCPPLKELQTELKAKHPSQLAMFAGLAHGVTGLSLDLFDFEFSQTQGLKSLDAILSVFAENPTNLAAILSNVAPIKGLPLAQDGSPSNLEIPDVPPTIQTKGRVKGNALMVYSGPKASALSEEKSQEKLNNKGLLGAAIDYTATLSSFDNMLGMLGGQEQRAVSNCIPVHSELQKFSNLNVKSTTQISFNDYGIETDVIASANPAPNDIALPGTYQVETMGDDCQWSVYGFETIKSDGTGSYSVIDDLNPSCELFNVEYKWEQVNGQLTIQEQKVLGRDSCDVVLQAQEPSNYQCELLPTGSRGFECLLDEESLYRYTPN